MEKAPLIYQLEHRDRSTQETRSHTLSHRGCLAQIDPRLRIVSLLYGRGSFGSVYQVCDEMARCGEWAVKLVPLHEHPKRWQVDEGEFLREAEMAKRLSDVGIGARVLGFRVCEDVTSQQRLGLIVMERLDETVRSYAKKYPRRFATERDWIELQVHTLVTRLADHFRLRHTDLHTENVMLELDPRTHRAKRVVLVDAGGVRPLGKMKALTAIRDAMRTYNKSLAMFTGSRPPPGALSADTTRTSASSSSQRRQYTKTQSAHMSGSSQTKHINKKRPRRSQQ